MYDDLCRGPTGCRCRRRDLNRSCSFLCSYSVATWRVQWALARKHMKSIPAAARCDMLLTCPTCFGTHYIQRSALLHASYYRGFKAGFGCSESWRMLTHTTCEAPGVRLPVFASVMNNQEIMVAPLKIYHHHHLRLDLCFMSAASSAWDLPLTVKQSSHKAFAVHFIVSVKQREQLLRRCAEVTTYEHWQRGWEDVWKEWRPLKKKRCHLDLKIYTIATRDTTQENVWHLCRISPLSLLWWSCFWRSHSGFRSILISVVYFITLIVVCLFFFFVLKRRDCDDVIVSVFIWVDRDWKNWHRASGTRCSALILWRCGFDNMLALTHSKYRLLNTQMYTASTLASGDQLWNGMDEKT